MTALRLLPDAETICVEFLKERNEVDAIVHGRVAAEIKPNSTLPYLTVVMSGGTVPIDKHFAAPTFQIDAWAENREAARNLAAVAHAAILEMNGTQGTRGVVTSVRTIIHDRFLDDPVKGRARYLFEIAVHLHVAPA